MKRYTLLFYSFIFLFFFISYSLDGQQKIHGAELSYAIKLGTTPPLRDILREQSTDPIKLQEYKKNKPKLPQNFRGRRAFEIANPDALPNGPDPVWQSVMRRGGELVIEPDVVFDGISANDSGVGVPDVNGDVSDQYFVEMTNTTLIRVFDLLGNTQTTFAANSIWSSIGFSSLGDPIIIYDREAERWFITEFSTSGVVLIAVSETNDPMGSWTAFSYNTPSFPDYPKYGIWPEAYVLTSNEGGPLPFYCINREDILSGADNVRVQRFTAPRYPFGGFQVLTPVDWIGYSSPAENSKPTVLGFHDDAWGGTSQDQIDIWEIDVNWNDQDSSVITKTEIPTAPFDSDFCVFDPNDPGFPCVPQPNNDGIDALPYYVMNRPQYRDFENHSSIVLNFTVDASGTQRAGVRWLELRKESEGWTNYQEGTFAPDDGLHRFMGQISIDSEGNIGLGYNVSSIGKFPSLRYTGRKGGDPLGQMTIQEFEFAEGIANNPGRRFGDYASISVDASDNFWYAGEYIRSNNTWGTKIVKFRLVPDSTDIGVASLISPVSSADLGETEEVVFEVKNFGKADQSDFEVGYIYDGGDPVIEMVSDTIKADSIYTHNFLSFIDVSSFGTHTLKLFTNIDKDGNRSNDTCVIQFRKFTQRDVAAVNALADNTFFCDSSGTVFITLQNVGSDTLFSADLTWQLNDQDVNQIPWTGQLLQDETDQIEILLEGLISGDNILQINATNPNGEEDQDEANNTVDIIIPAIPNGSGVRLELLTDNFPQETMWELTDEGGNIVASGGPYSEQRTLYIEEFCLEPEGCYTFSIFDTFGDGLSAQGVSGNFEIIRPDGFVLASLGNPSFGSQFSTEFCVNKQCLLNVDVMISHETGPDQNDGVLNIDWSDGSFPVEISIDGGSTFQLSSIFDDLAPGTYQIFVRDREGCIIEQEVTILACNLQVFVEVEDASATDVSDGVISIDAEGGNTGLSYSIDGGTSFVSSSIFENLAMGDYTVIVQDSLGCNVSQDVTVDVSTSIGEASFGRLLRVFPNPSNGIYQFEFKGIDDKFMLDYDIIDEKGSVIRESKAAKFNGVFKGSISLINYPTGNYFLRFPDKDVLRIIKLIKI